MGDDRFQGDRQLSDGSWQHVGNSGGRAPAGEEGIDLFQLVKAIKAHRTFIVLCGVLIFLVTMGNALTSKMTFTTTGRLYLGEVGAAKGDHALDLSGGNQTDMASEMEIVSSHSLVERAVLKSGLNVLVFPSDWEPLAYWEWRAAGRDLELLKVASVELKASDTRLDEGIRNRQTYSVAFDSNVSYTLYNSENREVAKGTLGKQLKTQGLSLMLLPGAKSVPRQGIRYTVIVEPLDIATRRAISNLDVYQPSSSDSSKVLNLTYSHSFPHTAANFLRSLMEVYLEQRQAWKTEDASAAEEFVTRQLQSMRQSLDRTEEKLAEYRSENKVVISSGETAALVSQLGNYENQRVQAQLQVAALQDILRALRSKNATLEAYMFGEAKDSVLQNMASNLAEARRRLAELRTKFTATAPDVIQEEEQVNAQLSMIRNYVRGRLQRANDNVRQLDQVISELETKLRGIPGAELGLAQIDRESEVYSKMFSFLLERQQQTAIQKASTISKNRILDYPLVPDFESSPTLGIPILSGILGLWLGMMVVVIRSLTSNALRSEQEVRAIKGTTPVFAMVPTYGAAAAKQKGKAKAKADAPAEPVYDVLAGGAERFAFAEAFRTLRTNLYHAGLDGKGSLVLVTSPMPGDGKSTCGLSLAAMLAADDKRTLVIDADVRKPSHHVLTRTAADPGLRSVLAGEAHWRDTVHEVSLAVGSMDVLNAGTGGSAELLSSSKMVQFLESVRYHYDVVVLDSASYPLVSDALVLARQVDFVLSILRLSHTARKVAENHLSDIQAVARRYALVVNNSEESNLGGHPYPKVAPLKREESAVQLSVVKRAQDRS